MDIRRVVKAFALLFLFVDIAALLFFFVWALQAGTREGEQAYAVAFLTVAALFVAVGGGMLAFGVRRGSTLGLGAAAVILGLPSIVGLAIWLDILK